MVGHAPPPSEALTTQVLDVAKNCVVTPTRSRSLTRGSSRGRSASRGRTAGVRSKSRSRRTDPLDGPQRRERSNSSGNGAGHHKVTRIRVKTKDGKRLDPETARRLVQANLKKERQSRSNSWTDFNSSGEFSGKWSCEFAAWE